MQNLGTQVHVMRRVCRNAGPALVRSTAESDYAVLDTPQSQMLHRGVKCYNAELICEPLQASSYSKRDDELKTIIGQIHRWALLFREVYYKLLNAKKFVNSDSKCNYIKVMLQSWPFL